MIDVVVPVYGQVDLALRCIKSVLASKNRVPFQLIVIDDGSPGPKVFRALKAYAATRKFTLLRNPTNLGFPATCNRAFALNPTHDVVLLNSDTEVYGDWLDRLVEVASSESTIGTVTPFASSGSISSYPHWLAEVGVEMEVTSRELDQMVAAEHRGVWAPAPTGVGFCMLFTRSCLNEVGNFNVAAFGHGYGEENDFCQRAIDRGWVNAITPGIFVHHGGGHSFGASKAARMARAIRVIEKLHPGYLPSVRAYIQQDPLANARTQIDRARIRRRTGNGAVLMVTHNWGGGTERHVQEITARLEAAGTAVLHCRPNAQNGQAFSISDPKTPETPNLGELSVSDSPHHFVEQLRSLGITHVHIHNLAGYSSLMTRYLTAALVGSDIRYDITVHDYQHWCPQISLVGITGQYCGEPNIDSCQTCVNHMGSPFGKVNVWEWRDGHQALLRGARKIFTPSRDVSARLARQIPGLATQVRPHEAITLKARPAPPRKVSRRIRVGVIGALSESKGRELLARLAAHAAEHHLPITFVIVGYASKSHTLTSLPNVRVTGRYEESALDGILSREQLDVIFFPAVFPETYSFTLTAALKSGLPIVAFDLGAIPERLRSHGVGTVLSLDLAWDPKALVDHLISAAQGQRFANASSHTLAYPSILADYYGLSPSSDAD
jgi:GT2 family glycosyltransferase/glycosyltransferase involved in cell wall biosynthesis